MSSNLPKKQKILMGILFLSSLALSKNNSTLTLGTPRNSDSNRETNFSLGKRISGYDNQAKGEKKVIGQKRLQQTESELFKDTNYPFYFDGSIQDKYKTLMQKVYFNSGSALANLEVIKAKKFDPKAVYCIIPDGRTDLVQSIKDQIGDKAIFLSPRWISYCIERNAIISLKELRDRAMVNLLPIDLPTPFDGLNEFSVIVKNNHFDLDRFYAMKQLVTILGFNLEESSSDK